MTERERLSLTIQVLGVGVVLFIGVGWIFTISAQIHNIFSGTWVRMLALLTDITLSLSIGLPVVLTLGLIAVMIRCLKQSK